MSEIRCSMCGEPNPDDLEFCQNCQARLKPMQSTFESEQSDELLQQSSPEIQGNDQNDRRGEINQELPSWLSEVMSEPESPVEPGFEMPEIEQQEPDAARAELLDWLESQQLDEQVQESEEVSQGDEGLIGIGPLAGLTGVLPAEPDISHIQKLPSQSIKLQITEKQLAHVETLESVISEEGGYHPFERKPAPETSSVWRIIIAVTFFLVILASLLFGGVEFAYPEYSTEVLTTSQLIGSIPNGVPVLVAVDYEPALSGEMDAILMPVLEQLVFKSSYLALVSTIPTGPLQAERLLSAVHQEDYFQFKVADQYINLGYIPGGAMGLLGFAQSPNQIVPLDLTGNYPWQNPALQDISSVADFALVVVATEKPDTAQNWIEQVKPLLGSTPLVMALSAQAGPVIRPYYESSPKQVDGLVIGLSDAVTYDNMYQRTSTATVYWNTFSLGILLACLLIMAGAFISALVWLYKGMRAASPKGSKA